MDAPAAFRQQLLGAIPRLRRYARSLVFDPHAADDLVQTALERALAHWHQFDQQRDILVWTLSIAHNAYMDDRRRHARMPIAEPPNSSGASLDDRHAAATPDIGLRLDLVAALKRLPVEQREPLLLVTLEQLSYAECAALRALLDGRAPLAGTPGLRRVV